MGRGISALPNSVPNVQASLIAILALWKSKSMTPMTVFQTLTPLFKNQRSKWGHWQLYLHSGTKNSRILLIRDVAQPDLEAQRRNQIFWKEKRYSKQGPLLIFTAWSLITSCFSVYAPARWNFSQVTKDDVFTHSVSHLHCFSTLGSLHAVSGTPNAFMNLPVLRKYCIDLSFTTCVTVVCLKSGHSFPNLCQVLLLYASGCFL